VGAHCKLHFTNYTKCSNLQQCKVNIETQRTQQTKLTTMYKKGPVWALWQRFQTLCFEIIHHEQIWNSTVRIWYSFTDLLWMLDSTLFHIIHSCTHKNSRVYCNWTRLFHVSLSLVWLSWGGDLLRCGQNSIPNAHVQTGYMVTKLHRMPFE